MARPEIKLKISNGSSASYSEILLRKFFAMVFIDSGGKKLDVFIATIFGGVADPAQNKDGFPLANYGQTTNTCFLNFAFESHGVSVQDSQITDITDSFCRQKDKIKSVWCNEDEPGLEEHNTEGAVVQRLKEMYPALYPAADPHVSLDPNTCSTVYEIRKGSAPTHCCLAVKGACKIEAGEKDKPRYMLSVPPKMRVDGMEAMNWIHTEITLSESILNRHILFSIDLGQKFYTPDFTLYFAPPAGKTVNEDTAALTLKNSAKGIPNNIQNVRDDTTVLFQEWVALDIEGRKKARIQLRQLDAWKPPFTALSDAGGLSVECEIFEPDQANNYQFLLGLVVAFILSFCSDKTRINDFYECLEPFCQCEKVGGVCLLCKRLCSWISILAPVVVLTTFSVYAYNLKKCLPSTFPKKHRVQWVLLRVCRGVSFISFSALAVYIFGLWPVASHLIGGVISCFWNEVGIITGFGLNFLSSAVYIFILSVIWKRPPSLFRA